MPSATLLLLLPLLMTIRSLTLWGQAQPHRLTKPTSQTASQRALDLIIGHSLFTCHINPIWSDLDDYRPYFDGTNWKGASIPDRALASYFRTNDELKIAGAELVASSDGSKSKTGVSLLIENQRNKVKAGTVIDVPTSQVNPSSILAALTRGSNYRLHPTDSLFPSIGMTRDDVLCGLGVPEHTNTDDLGGDQMVYHGGQVYVYISPRSDRVTNVQTSFR